MGRKKKEEIEEEYEEDFEDLNDDTPSKEWESTNFDFSEDNMANNALQYASIVSTPSEIAKQFKHIPKEARYAFFENDEAKELKHWDKNYRNYQYMRKVFALQAQEDIEILKNRLSLYNIETEDQFKEYCKANNNMIIYNTIKNDPNKIKEILDHIQNLQENGFYEDVKNQNEGITQIYENYRQKNQVAPYIDDLGMTGNMFSTSIISMGRGGKEREAQVTVISATKNLDLKKEQEEKTDYKNKIGGFFNKFR